MTRYDETKAAILSLLKDDLKATPEKPVGMYSIGIPLGPKGFTQDELYMALRGLEGEKVLKIIEDRNAVVLLREL